MNDYWRESLSYFGLYRELSKVKKIYEPSNTISKRIIVWVHGGGWNAGAPKDFDYVGQCIAGAGYRFISLGYRLSPKNKYPAQIEDVCMGYNHALQRLNAEGIGASQIIICGSSAGARLSSILTYSKDVQDAYGVDVSNVIGYVGWSRSYCFNDKVSITLKEESRRTGYSM